MTYTVSKTTAARIRARDPALTNKLHQCVTEIQRLEKRVVKDRLAIGAQLAKARNLLRADYQKGSFDGKWRNWLRDDLKMSHTHAANFIHVWERYGKGGKAALPPLPFTVLAALAAPEASPLMVKQIEAHVAAGGTITRREVSAAIKETPAYAPRGGKDLRKVALELIGEFEVNDLDALVIFLGCRDQGLAYVWKAATALNLKYQPGEIRQLRGYLEAHIKDRRTVVDE